MPLVLPDTRLHLFALRPEQLQDELAKQGYEARPQDCRRLLAQVISHGGTVSQPKGAVEREFLRRVRKDFSSDRLELIERVTDRDDSFTKYLFRSPDGSLSEAVRIPLEKPGLFTVCLSTQVGCAMACDFCATGRLGLSRHLEAWEMVAAFLAVREDSPGRVKGALFQGQGEPFHNYDAVLQAASVLHDPCGGRIAQEAITISTVGLIPQIRRFTAEGHKYRLIVSLTSAVASRRTRLLPVAGQCDLEELVAAIRDYAKTVPGRVTVAWVVIAGENTGVDEVECLQELLGDLPLRLNLIDVNDPRPDGYRRAQQEEMDRFFDALQVLKVPIVRRYSGGQNEHAGCGMLAAQRKNGSASGEEKASCFGSSGQAPLAKG